MRALVTTSACPAIRTGQAFLLRAVVLWGVGLLTAARPQSLPAAEASFAPRELAPGVLTVVPAQPQDGETVSGPRPLFEIARGWDDLAWQPTFSPESQTLKSLAELATFRRPIWQLEFSYKPMRTVAVQLRDPLTGETKPTLVWYLVYKVRNTGQQLRPVGKPDDWGHATFQTEHVQHGIRFFPQFVLQSLDFQQSYRDQILPAAVAQIQQAEDRNTRLLDSVEISKTNLPVSRDDADHSVWGVATWAQVDPRTDFLTVQIQGLSNAYEWDDPAKPARDGQAWAPGRSFRYKTLQLNFWRPGDTARQEQDKVRNGVPFVEASAEQQRLHALYGVSSHGDYLWKFLAWPPQPVAMTKAAAPKR